MHDLPYSPWRYMTPCVEDGGIVRAGLLFPSIFRTLQNWKRATIIPCRDKLNGVAGLIYPNPETV